MGNVELAYYVYIATWQREFFVPAGTHLDIKQLRAVTALPLWSHTCDHLFNELHARLITCQIFVCWQRLIAGNVAELFSSNRGVSHFYTSCCINERSREGPFWGSNFSQLLILVYHKLAI